MRTIWEDWSGLSTKNCDFCFFFIFCLLYNFFIFSVEDPYESVSDREIRQVFEGQNRIHLEIKQVNRQIAMLMDEQRKYVSIVSEEIAKKAGHAGSGQVGKRNRTTKMLKK